jgi:uncharacterized damage-inducible protein DinB
MNSAEIFLERLDAYEARLRDALEDLSDEELLIQPGPNDNPAGWIAWHMTRFEDRTIAHLSGASQVWTEGAWHDCFGISEAPDDTGVGHNLEQVAALRPTREALLGYFTEVRVRTRAFLQSLDDERLGEEVEDFFRSKKIAAGLIIGRFFGDFISHVGQIGYIRGHLKGWGKYGR